jgi:hypothetical protein
MNVIKEWKNIKEIMNHYPDFHQSKIYESLNKNVQRYGFYWVDKNKPKVKEVILKPDEIFKKIGIIKNRDFNAYEISNYGTVRNIARNSYVKSSLNAGGYPFITLSDDITHKGCSKTIHHYVALLFVGDKPSPIHIVNHIDEDKTNCYYKNLEWATPKENSDHSISKKINQIDPQTNEIINTFKSIEDAARSLGLNCSPNISNCCNGKTKSNITHGYKWEFVN